MEVPVWSKGSKHFAAVGPQRAGRGSPGARTWSRINKNQNDPKPKSCFNVFTKNIKIFQWRFLFGRSGPSILLRSTMGKAYPPCITTHSGTGQKKKPQYINWKLRTLYVKEIYIILIPDTKHGCTVLSEPVITCLFQDCVICTLATFLRCGSRFSGSLSGSEP